MSGKRVNHGSMPVQLLPRLMLLMVFFMIGAVIGSFFSANISGGSQQYIADYLTGEEGQIIVGSLPSAKRTVLLDVLLLALVFASAFFRLGGVMIPLCLGIKGFLLSMLITSFVTALGPKGYITAFLVVFAYGFITVTSLTLLAVQAFGITLERPSGKRGRPYIDKAYYITACIALAATILASVAHVYLAPVLSKTAVSILHF